MTGNLALRQQVVYSRLLTMCNVVGLNRDMSADPTRQAQSTALEILQNQSQTMLVQKEI